ncbi:MAG: L-fucose/L-arabinose isomerase family protein [Planctomycetota bacterium]
MAAKKPTLGVIVANRGFFPDHLCKSGRKEILDAVKAAGAKSVALKTTDTTFGSVESYEDAKKCAELFKQHRDDIDGIVVTLPNFGDERGVADTLKLADLDVPVLIQATPDQLGSMTIENRRDSFCGKISVCNNLRQYNIPYTLTQMHTEAPDSDAFTEDLASFIATCRVVKGLRTARLGAIGARPAAFNTVRYSEKLLQDSGITVDVIDLFDLFGRVEKLDDNDQDVKKKLKKLKDYIPCEGIPDESLLKMAKFGLEVDRWMAENELDASAVQCWTAMEQYFGVVPCSMMSMMSDNLLPSACEVDITGAVGMYAMVLASGVPSALLDWNNNYGDDPDKCVIFHCSNLPKSVFADVKMDYQEIIAGDVGKDNTYGTCVGRIATGPFTYCRVSTADCDGIVQAYVGEGEITDDKLGTFGGFGVAHIPNLQGLLQYMCQMGFEHHVAISHSQCSEAVVEALDNYLGWDVYHHIG